MSIAQEIVNIKKRIESNPAKPTYLQPVWDFPPELTALPVWLYWTAEWKLDKQGAGRWSKTPRRVFNPQVLAKSNDPLSWVTYPEARDQWQHTTTMDGCGIVLRHKLCGFDIDNCVLPDGSLKDAAREIIEVLDTYTELSPSGTGVKGVFFGSFPELLALPEFAGITETKQLGKKIKIGQDIEVEFYDETSPRYFTLTGHRLATAPNQVNPRQTQFAKIYGAIFAAKIAEAAKPKPTTATYTAQERITLEVEDLEVIETARAAANGDKFSALYDRAELDNYKGDHSSGDMALCQHLAFWAGPDPDAIDRLFRGSALYRDKWEREDYRENTISKAIDRTEEFFDWSRQNDRNKMAQQEAKLKEIFEASQERSQSPQETPAPTTDPAPDRYRDDLSRAGVKLDRVTSSKGYTNYLVTCPCCNLQGRFWRREEDGRTGYACPNDNKKSWSDGKALFPTRATTSTTDDKGGVARLLLTICELRKRVQLQPRKFLVPNYAEFGAVTLLSGLSGCGKSELVIMMIFCSITGTPFLGMDIPKCHWILVDPENLFSVTLQRFDYLFGPEVADTLGNWVTILDDQDDAFPSPITPEFLEEVVAEIRNRDGHDCDVAIVIDTFRRAYQADPKYDENGAEFPTRTLGGLKGFASKTFAAVITLHHNNWGGRCSGSTAFRGSCDYASEYIREEDSTQAKWKFVRGRGCELQPILVVNRDRETKHITLVSRQSPEEEKKKKQSFENYLREIVLHACPEGPENAANKAAVVRLVRENLEFRNQHSAKEIKLTDKRIREIIDQLVTRGDLHKTDSPNPNHCRYYIPNPIEDPDDISDFIAVRHPPQNP